MPSMRFHKSWPNVLSNIETFPQPTLVFRSKFRFLRLSTARKLILYLGGFSREKHPPPLLFPSVTMFHQRCSFISFWRQGDALVSVSVVWYQCVIRDLMKVYGRSVSYGTALLLQHRVLKRCNWNHWCPRISRTVPVFFPPPHLSLLYIRGNCRDFASPP